MFPKVQRIKPRSLSTIAWGAVCVGKRNKDLPILTERTCSLNLGTVDCQVLYFSWGDLEDIFMIFLGKVNAIAWLLKWVSLTWQTKKIYCKIMSPDFRWCRQGKRKIMHSYITRLLDAETLPGVRAYLQEDSSVCVMSHHRDCICQTAQIASPWGSSSEATWEPYPYHLWVILI